MKRRIALIAVTIALLSVIATGTLAYYTVSETAENVITAGSLKLALREKTASGEDFPLTGVEIMPGDVISKIVTVENTGDHPAWVRIKLEKSVNDPALDAENRMELDINDKDWTYSDGYYYYNNVLEPGKSTEPLFTTVYMSGYIDNDYLGCKFTLRVLMEGVQSENNGSDVMSAAGWSLADDTGAESTETAKIEPEESKKKEAEN